MNTSVRDEETAGLAHLDSYEHDNSTEAIGLALARFVGFCRRHKRILVAVPLCATIAAVVTSLVMAPTYRAVTRMLPPQQNQTGAAALLSQLGGAAGGLSTMAGLKNPNDLYVGMLKSRTVADRIIKRFNLMSVYETELIEESRLALSSNTVVSSARDGLITIEVDDHNRQRAADVANAYVTELTALTRNLAVTEAAQRRVFYEQQLEQAKDHLATAEVSLKSGLDAKGVVSVDADSRGMVETIARLRAQVSAKEIELNSMRSVVTADNVDFKRVASQLGSLRAELNRLENGPSHSSRVSTAGSAAGFESIRLVRDVKYYQMLYELLAKQYEMARLDEARNAAVIQVLDPAVAPEMRHRPRRTMLVLAAAVLSVLLAFTMALVRDVIGTARRHLRPHTNA